MADDRAGSSGSGRSKHTTVGDFYVESVVGQGSFANVYLGVHKDTKEVVAVKSVELKKLSTKLKDNLYSEISILKKLRHPHIVALHDCVKSPTHINLVMEYCELGDLSLFIKKREKLSTHPVTHDLARKYPISPKAGLHEVVIRHFLKQIASAVEFLRVGNYVHRDIKPQNLLLIPPLRYRQESSRPIMVASRDSLVPAVGLASLPMLKLADFGFARVLPSTSLADTLCGSPLYMAPEILRYEKYDAKADLWSVGTVLYEMAAGRPPNKARNHVELLRKIEESNDVIAFPRDAAISPDLKALIRALLKRSPHERIGWEAFFGNIVVMEDIPGLVEDDVPQPPVPLPADETITTARPPERSLSRRNLARIVAARASDEALADQISSPTARSPRDAAVRSPKVAIRPSLEGTPRHTYTSPSGAAHAEHEEGLSIRPRPHPSHTAPGHPPRYSDTHHNVLPDNIRERRMSSGSRPGPPTRKMTEEETAEQEVADMRDYVMIEKKQVEINAFADELDAGPALMRRASTTGTVRRSAGRRTSSSGGDANAPIRVPLTAPVDRETSPVPKSQALVGRTRGVDAIGGSPPRTSSYLTKAIQEASKRLMGYYTRQPHFPTLRGQSPPQYNPHLVYPPSPSLSAPIGLIEDGRSSTRQGADEDMKCTDMLERLATRSDVVFGFAEVKLRQLFPSLPSADRALGGGEAVDEPTTEDELTLDAVVGLSEEALVLYIKTLTFLASAMDLADAWWGGAKRRSENGREPLPVASDLAVARINSIVQWVRSRFNQVLEKTELAKLKLVNGQAVLRDTSSHEAAFMLDADVSGSLTGASPGTIVGGGDGSGPASSTGVSAEKLLYDRAVEMSRAAAIREISNHDLEGCEISYLTAARMLECVLSADDHGYRDDESGSKLSAEDHQSVQGLITMIKTRLAAVRSKIRDIAFANMEHPQSVVQAGVRRRSGEIVPRTHSGQNLSS